MGGILRFGASGKRFGASENRDGYSNAASPPQMTNTPEQEMRLHVYAALPRPAVPYNIKAALKILNPKPADKEQCLEHIKAAFEVVEHASRVMTPRPANIRDAVAELLKALKKAKIAKAKLAKLNSVIASYFE